MSTKKQLGTSNLDINSIDSEALIEKIDKLITKPDASRSTVRSNSNKLNSELPLNSIKDDKMGLIDRFFTNSYDLLLFKIYQGFNLIMSSLLLYVYLFVSSSWTLALFMIGILLIHVPLGLHVLAGSTESKSVNDTYFIQISIYYFILSINSMIYNIYYGDSIIEIMKHIVLSNVPAILSIICFYISAYSIIYNRNNLNDDGIKLNQKNNSSSDRIVCIPENESSSDSSTSKNESNVSNESDESNKTTSADNSDEDDEDEDEDDEDDEDEEENDSVTTTNGDELDSESEE